jgi:hypothetical protein
MARLINNINNKFIGDHMKPLVFFLCIITFNIDSLAQKIPESEVIFQTRFASSPNQITTFEV